MYPSDDEPVVFRARKSDPHIRLHTDGFVIVPPDADYIDVVHRMPRNLGYLAGLLADDVVEPVSPLPRVVRLLRAAGCRAVAVLRRVSVSGPA